MIHRVRQQRKNKNKKDEFLASKIKYRHAAKILYIIKVVSSYKEAELGDCEDEGDSKDSDDDEREDGGDRE